MFTDLIAFKTGERFAITKEKFLIEIGTSARREGTNFICARVKFKFISENRITALENNEFIIQM